MSNEIVTTLTAAFFFSRLFKRPACLSCESVLFLILVLKLTVKNQEDIRELVLKWRMSLSLILMQSA